MRNVKRKMGKLMKTVLVAAAIFVAGTLAGQEQMHVQAAGRPVEIKSCLISGDDVLCMIEAKNVPSSDDGKYYVYANEVYEDGPEGEIVATVDAESSARIVPQNRLRLENLPQNPCHW